MDAISVKTWPFAFLSSERRTPPRLLPLWVMAMIALAGHTPGSSAWGLAGVLSLALGILIAPLVGTIAPTVVAYVSLLACVAGMAAITWIMPVGDWYREAWSDPGATGFLAMVLLGAVAVGGVSSTLWALLVGIEAVRRYARRRELRSLRDADSAGESQPAIEVTARPVAAVPMRRKWTAPLLRAFTATLYIALLVPLPSFLVMSGVFIRPAFRPHEGLDGIFSDFFTASVWPLLTIGWLAVGAFVAWLAWRRGTDRARAIGIGSGAFVIAAVVFTAATFAIVPTEGKSQGFAPWVLDYCPPPLAGATCEPEWLFSAPELTKFTASVAPLVALALLVAAGLLVTFLWRGRGGERAATPRA